MVNTRFRSYTIAFFVFAFALHAVGSAALSQTKRSVKKKPKISKEGLVATPRPSATPTRGAGDAPSKPIVTKPPPITPLFVETTATYEVPFFEKCPKQPTDGSRVFCVGIGVGSDVATPEEVEKIHNTISRIFYGRRFVMVKLKGETIYNQEDDAMAKKCDFFIQTKYSSPFEKGDGARFLEFLSAITKSDLPGNTNKIINPNDNQQSNNLNNLGDSAIRTISSLNPFSKKPKFELNLRVFRIGDTTTPAFSIFKAMKVGKNDAKPEVLNAIYRLLRESTEMLQTGVMDPSKVSGSDAGADKDKKKKNEKN